MRSSHRPVAHEDGQTLFLEECEGRFNTVILWGGGRCRQERAGRAERRAGPERRVGRGGGFDTRVAGSKRDNGRQLAKTGETLLQATSEGDSCSKAVMAVRSEQTLSTRSYEQQRFHNYQRSSLEQNGGSHWSLLLLDNTTRTAVHYDSVGGLNERHAAALLVNLGLDSVPISEGQTFQQTESFECGVHVLVNARLLLGQVCDRFALTHNTLHHTDTSETHGSTNATLVPSSQSINNSRSNLANDKVWKVVKGTNNLPLKYNGGAGYNGGCGKREALHCMADLLYTTRIRFPNSVVLVDSILPRSDISGTALAQFNEQLELMSGNFGVVFLNWNQLV
ncbi:hypothetical protein J6590_080262 [Homalodisca vitripennis]|nr:hypothetical protein J6590_080262 [Homalodisca vitripennis]